jgi:Transposase zinc-ribbon domain
LRIFRAFDASAAVSRDVAVISIATDRQINDRDLTIAMKRDVLERLQLRIADALAQSPKPISPRSTGLEAAPCPKFCLVSAMKSVLSDRHFHHEAAAYTFVEARLWPNGAVCAHCGGTERISKMGGESTRIGTYKCYQCRKPLTVNRDHL